MLRSRQDAAAVKKQGAKSEAAAREEEASDDVFYLPSEHGLVLRLHDVIVRQASKTTGASVMQSIRKNDQDSAIATTQATLVQYAYFPGFSPLAPTPLPGTLEASELLHEVGHSAMCSRRLIILLQVSAAHEGRLGVLIPEFRANIVSDASVFILLDAFWWLWIERWRPGQDKHSQVPSASFYPCLITLFIGPALQSDCRQLCGALRRRRPRCPRRVLPNLPVCSRTHPLCVCPVPSVMA